MRHSVENKASQLLLHERQVHAEIEGGFDRAVPLNIKSHFSASLIYRRVLSLKANIDTSSIPRTSKQQAFSYREIFHGEKIDVFLRYILGSVIHTLLVIIHSNLLWWMIWSIANQSIAMMPFDHCIILSRSMSFRANEHQLSEKRSIQKYESWEHRTS